MSKPVEADFVPNNELPCMVCGQTPTVDIYVDGKREVPTELCGPCTWGEADTINPENW